MHARLMLATFVLWLALGLCACRRPEQDSTNPPDKTFVYRVEGVTLGMTIHGTNIPVAGLVEITLNLTHDSDMDVAVADSAHWRDAFELQAHSSEPGRLIDNGRRVVRTLTYALEPIRAGHFEVTAITVDYWPTRRPLHRQRFMTEPFAVQVTSLLADMAGGDANSADILWEPWVDGFTRAMALRSWAWEALLERADDETCATMAFIMALRDIYAGTSTFSDEEIDRIDQEAPDLIPNCVAMILHQSRPELVGAMPAPLADQPFKSAPRPGRNDPCPCGSGRKYKQCCGKN